MAIRRSDNDTLHDLINEYGMVVVLDELITIFDADLTTDAEEEALGVLDRALRKVVKIIGDAPTRRVRGRPGGARNPIEEDEEEDLEDLDDEDEEEDE